MGVGVASGSRRGGYAELNLVPFIDLLSTCITFLLATAIWIEVSALPVDQPAQGGAPTAATVAPLVVRIRADGLEVGRTPEDRDHHALGAAGYDWAALTARLTAERRADDPAIVLLTDDGVAYEHAIHALDVSRQLGFTAPRFGG